MTSESSAGREALRTAEFKESREVIKRVRPPTNGEVHLDHGSAWGAFGRQVMAEGAIPNGIELRHEGGRNVWWSSFRAHRICVEHLPRGGAGRRLNGARCTGERTTLVSSHSTGQG
jgi:hypothetical protein